MKKLLLIVGALGLSFGALNAQNHRCATMEHFEKLKAQDPGYEARLNDIEQKMQQQIASNQVSRSNSIVTIPVVFHILYSTNNSTQNISQARVLAQLAVLNNDYAGSNSDTSLVPAVFKPLIGNSGIQFCLAVRDPFGNPTDGIIRKQTSTTSFNTSNNIKYDAQGGSNAWPAGSYLNIWVGNLSGGLLGYAQFPGGAAATDGVVVLNGSVGGPGALGTTSGYNRGRTATHEVGHWLNLRHINGDGNCGNDQVADTPTQAALNFGCPSFPKISCTNGPNGEMFMNYMDYTDDACMYMFTPGQGTRMNAAVNASRVSLLSSLGCTPTNVGLNDPSSAGIIIAPNPTNGDLIITNTNNAYNTAQVKVNNVIGQTIMTDNYFDFTGTHHLNLSEFRNGLYFLEINTGNERFVKRIILNK